MAHHTVIEKELESGHEWMRDQWLVMMRQGCRVAETAVPLDRIDLGAGAITFRLKGGRLYTVRMHPDLLPLVAKVRGRGDSVLVQANIRSATSRWCELFRSLGMPYSSHCCRVTVITRLLRAGHSPALVSAFIGRK